VKQKKRMDILIVVLIVYVAIGIVLLLGARNANINEKVRQQLQYEKESDSNGNGNFAKLKEKGESVLAMAHTIQTMYTKTLFPFVYTVLLPLHPLHETLLEDKEGELSTIEPETTTTGPQQSTRTSSRPHNNNNNNNNDCTEWFKTNHITETEFRLAECMSWLAKNGDVVHTNKHRTCCMWAPSFTFCLGLLGEYGQQVCLGKRGPEKQKLYITVPLDTHGIREISYGNTSRYNLNPLPHGMIAHRLVLLERVSDPPSPVLSLFGTPIVPKTRVSPIHQDQVSLDVVQQSPSEFKRQEVANVVPLGILLADSVVDSDDLTFIASFLDITKQMLMRKLFFWDVDKTAKSFAKMTPMQYVPDMSSGNDDDDDGYNGYHGYDTVFKAYRKRQDVHVSCTVKLILCLLLLEPRRELHFFSGAAASLPFIWANATSTSTSFPKIWICSDGTEEKGPWLRDTLDCYARFSVECRLLSVCAQFHFVLNLPERDPDSTRGTTGDLQSTGRETSRLVSTGGTTGDLQSTATATLKDTILTPEFRTNHFSNSAAIVVGGVQLLKPRELQQQNGSTKDEKEEKAMYISFPCSSGGYSQTYKLAGWKLGASVSYSIEKRNGGCIQYDESGEYGPVRNCSTNACGLYQTPSDFIGDFDETAELFYGGEIAPDVVQLCNLVLPSQASQQQQPSLSFTGSLAALAIVCNDILTSLASSSESSSSSSPIYQPCLSQRLYSLYNTATKKAKLDTNIVGRTSCLPLAGYASSRESQWDPVKGLGIPSIDTWKYILKP
jgi:hypothetical protein